MTDVRRSYWSAAFLVFAGITLIAVAAGPVHAQEYPIVFSDDFSQGAAQWEILWDPNGSIQPGAGYLVFGDYGQEVHMRIPEILTNDFNLVIDADLNTGSEDWLGIRFGATEGHPWYYGHVIFIRPNGTVQLLREPAPGQLKNDATDNFYLGKLPAFTGLSTLEVLVRPEKLEIIVDGLHTLTFDDISVRPGYVELYAVNPGPVKLYYVELAARTQDE